MNTFIKKSLFLSTWLALTITLSGCATTEVKGSQIVTKSMLIQQLKPVAPSPETATQRDVALYITLLRGWGNSLSEQLSAIEKLIDEESK